MIFEYLIGIAWWALQIGVLVMLLGGLVLALKRARRKRLPPPAWRAAVVTAQQYKSDYYDSGYKRTPVRGEVAVRVVRGTGDFLTVGAVQTDAEDFETELQQLVAGAEDKAAALNAAEAELR